MFLKVIVVASWVGFFSTNFIGAGSTERTGFVCSGFFLIIKLADGAFNVFVGLAFCVSVEPITIN